MSFTIDVYLKTRAFTMRSLEDGVLDALENGDITDTQAAEVAEGLAQAADGIRQEIKARNSARSVVSTIIAHNARQSSSLT